MYEVFYNFKTKPFALLPDCSFLYPGSEHQAAYSRLEYGLLNQAPFMVLTGDPGMGKTSLLQKLIAAHETTHRMGLVTHVRYDLDHILPWILLSLGLSVKRLDPIEAYHVFSQYLIQESTHHRRVVLIVDEAQSLGAELLEELRLLSNLNDGMTLKLQIILSGQPDLRTLLQRIDMTQLAQRIVIDYHLKPLSELDTVNCIRHRLQVAEGNPSIFSDKACSLVYRLSRGNPRLINQLSDMALTYGFAEQARVITSQLVAQAGLERSKGGILPLFAKEELEALAAASVDASELGDPIPRSTLAMRSKASVSDPPSDSPGEAYALGMVLKDEERLKEAVDMFQSAARDKSMWLKAYKQVGLCYMKMKEHQAAIQAFRMALNDRAASSREIVEVRYCLARNLESVGEASEAYEVYHGISRSTPTFRDVADRLRRLKRPQKLANNGRESPGENDSWFGGVIDNFQRLLTGAQK